MSLGRYLLKDFDESEILKSGIVSCVFAHLTACAWWYIAVSTYGEGETADRGLVRWPFLICQVTDAVVVTGTYVVLL